MDDGDDGPTPGEARAALDRAIEERPGEVVAFLDRIERANDLLDAGGGAETSRRGDARPPADIFSQLTEATSTLFGAGVDGEPAPGSLAALAATVGTNTADLERALRTLARLERDGTLAELAAAGETLRTLEAAVGGDALDLASDADRIERVGALVRAVDASGESADERLGLLGLARELRDEEVQRGMARLVALARELGREE